TEEEIKAILKEAESGTELSELCGQYDITPAELHLWKLKLGQPEGGEATARTDPALRIMRFVATALAVIGLAMLLWSGYNLAGGSANPPFAKATGKIVTSDRARRTGEEGTDRYEYSIVYEYSVKDKRYSSNKIRLGPTVGRDYEEYPVGREVTVYYEEQQPGLAILKPEISPDVTEPFKIGFSWLTAAFIL